MSLNPLANTVYFSGRFRAELSVALAEEERRKSEPSYHFDNALEDFSMAAESAADNMLAQLRTDTPELPNGRVPKMNKEQQAIRMAVLDHLFGDKSTSVVVKAAS